MVLFYEKKENHHTNHSVSQYDFVAVSSNIYINVRCTNLRMRKMIVQLFSLDLSFINLV